jgi:hypothetical protein
MLSWLGKEKKMLFDPLDYDAKRMEEQTYSITRRGRAVAEESEVLKSIREGFIIVFLILVILGLFPLVIKYWLWALERIL